MDLQTEFTLKYTHKKAATKEKESIEAAEFVVYFTTLREKEER